ncbi:unnamed protein product [Pedinophyceae sp. YPF-701]|nr:unnamed protein product [Pedinophyceae sp. YPF-701]
MSAPPSRQETDRTYVEVTPEPLDLQKLVQFVTDPGAGAISTFIGTTRDTFEGKKVVRLEYEAYVPMALAKLQEVCDKAAAKWDVRKVAMAHRTGLVGVTEASVIIAVSSAHRLEAIEACHFGIDDLKATVPIWKREVYEDGSAWKENKESRNLYNAKRADEGAFKHPPSDAPGAPAP